MAQFSYKARRRSGEVVQGVLDAADRTGVLQQIEKLGLMPVSIEAAKGSEKKVAKTGGPAAKGGLSSLLPPAIREMVQGRRKPKLRELASFTQQLANLLKSGMPLTVALNSMTHLGSKGIPADVTKQLKSDVTEGRSLSDAMLRQPDIFSDLYINMVRAGEQSGALREVLLRLAQHYERFSEVQSRFTSALIYPCVVASVGVVIIFFFMTFMMPKFMSIFEGMKIPLPASTMLLMSASHFFSHYWWLILLGIMCVAIVFQRFKSSAYGRRSIDGWMMKAPVVGHVVRLNLYGQFSRTLGTLMHNGVPVLTALKITEQIIPNIMLKEAIANTRNAVTDGKTLAQPLARSKVFPQLMIDLIRIGEETGDVPGSLENLADTYENELNIALRVLTNLIEPAMIIVMAIGIGFLLLSILSAMFTITSNIGN